MTGQANTYPDLLQLLEHPHDDHDHSDGEQDPGVSAETPAVAHASIRDACGSASVLVLNSGPG
jgi:hypothetical protein